MILNLILVAGLLVTLGIVLLLLFSKKDIAKKYLAPFFLALFFEVFCFYAQLHDNMLGSNIGYLLSEGLGSFSSVFLWLYVCTIVNRPISNRTTLYYFIFPILYLLVIVIPISICLFSEEWFFDVYKVLAYNNDIVTLLLSLIHMIYLSLSLRVLFKHQKNLKKHFSQTSSQSLNWLKNICYGGFILLALDISTTIYERVFGELSWNIGYITIVGLCVSLLFLAFYGLKQQKVMLPVFVYETEPNQTTISTSIKERVYLKKFDDKEVVDYREKAQNTMGEDNLFQKPNLVLTDLAQEIGLTSKQTTELLNYELKTNFYDFVNNYRVEEVKSRIASDDFKHLTILAIGFDSGFQSKSSFNRVFKKITGLSPSEYKKSMDK